MYQKSQPAIAPPHAQVHVVARTSSGKIVCVSFWARKIGAANIAWANGTVTSSPQDKLFASVRRDQVFALGPMMNKVVDDVKLTTNYSSLHVLSREFEIIVTPKSFRLERNVKGLQHRLDVQIKPQVAEAEFAVPPHGIIGQVLACDLDHESSIPLPFALYFLSHPDTHTVLTDTALRDAR